MVAAMLVRIVRPSVVQPNPFLVRFPELIEQDQRASPGLVESPGKMKHKSRFYRLSWRDFYKNRNSLLHGAKPTDVTFDVWNQE
jgi:hypothetical protein